MYSMEDIAEGEEMKICYMLPFITYHHYRLALRVYGFHYA